MYKFYILADISRSLTQPIRKIQGRKVTKNDIKENILGGVFITGECLHRSSCTVYMLEHSNDMPVKLLTIIGAYPLNIQRPESRNWNDQKAEKTGKAQTTGTIPLPICSIGATMHPAPIGDADRISCAYNLLAELNLSEFFSCSTHFSYWRKMQCLVAPIKLAHFT
jgi:hypothetical protein